MISLLTIRTKKSTHKAKNSKVKQNLALVSECLFKYVFKIQVYL